MPSGRAFASATTSASVLYLDLLDATIIMPPSEIAATGANESVVYLISLFASGTTTSAPGELPTMV
ncbi:hypothetical protein D9M70_567630 [compost metagenome]